MLFCERWVLLISVLKRYNENRTTLSLRKDVLPRRGRRFYQLVYKEDHEE